MIIFCILLSHSMKICLFKSLFLSFYCLFMVLESPVSSLFFTEPRLKSDLFGTIIWYQSLGGSFQFQFGRFFTGKPPET
ncbi:hypothetical protein HanRHA438_Chr12g0558391 [Helianthus annuus]|uniref:Uncharacterized protein n=1 Tax=Helianthus annuus TaxID=4232 RepID=A0A251T2Z0_HELAN|nr:hypothetical protein HanXRQr2_Chr12g0547051 [Helianthus annuus]KAJ0867024.1 hypothetical protein HanRHA438_Chr12g0558391 [Helianthus annuus]